MFATQKSHQSSPIVVAFDGTGNAPNHGVGPCHVGLQRGGGVDARLGKVHVQLVVVVLQIVGGGNDRGGAVPRARTVGGSAVVVYGDKDGGGGFQIALLGGQGQEIVGDPVGRFVDGHDVDSAIGGSGCAGSRQAGYAHLRVVVVQPSVHQPGLHPLQAKHVLDLP